jgi:hypothetical protein
MGEQRSRLRPWRPPQQSGHRQGVFFSLPSFGLGAFLTLPRAKPDDTAAERRSISASRNALAINVILKAAMTSPPKLRSFPHLNLQIASAAIGDLFMQPVTALTRFFRSKLTGGTRQALQPSALSECRKINSRWGIPSTRAIGAGRHAVETVLWPALLRLNTRYPDIKVEVSIEPALTDIVTAQYDAGVRRRGTDRPGYDRPAHRP